MCGEKLNKRRDNLKVVGSPPRVRGKATFEIPVTKSDRITPACAGKSKSNAFLASTAQDHPRVCGEKRFWVEYNKN